ncbi:MAG: asparaginase [Planctomycetia bacterium]|nr:MAG: asparaginase [Planctomycetia bacterium]
MASRIVEPPAPVAEQPVRIVLLTTGGTFEKTYDETDGSLRNIGSVLDKVLASIRLPSLTLRHIPVMSKDSLDLTDEDRVRIVRTVQEALPESDGVVVVHGTDTLDKTGEALHRELGTPPHPVVLTGAMRPYEFRDTDAYQNLIEALLACRLAPPGVYVAMHNQVLRFPGVTKDRARGTFVRRPAAV